MNNLPCHLATGRRRHIPWFWPACSAAALLLVLTGLSWPCLAGMADADDRAKALYCAKQIGLMLKLFAGDNDGVYPRQGVPAEMTVAPTNSNEAFACLFPTYTQSEKVFGNKLSAYQTLEADNKIDGVYTGKPVKTLEPGENVYAYVMGLTDMDSPDLPLVVDGTDGTGHYKSDPALRGGTWSGEAAVVIHLDNSGRFVDLAGPADARFIPRPHDPQANLLDFSATGKDLRLLDPAVGPKAMGRAAPSNP